MNKSKIDHIPCDIPTLRAIRDAMEVLNGSWKLPILVSLKAGPKRFRQISKEVEGISDKMLSKELKSLESNYLVKRTVRDTFPPTVEYEVTEHTHTLQDVMMALRNWGVLHRKKIVGK
jgi:DNA-binding HxlR family transcriptional regulator